MDIALGELSKKECLYHSDLDQVQENPSGNIRHGQAAEMDMKAFGFFSNFLL